jgi:hypothetical protein
MRLARPLVLSAAAMALAATPAAYAATLEPLQPCYRSVDATTRENVHVEARDFTPGAAVNVAIDGVTVQRDVIALPDGSVSGDLNAPYQRRGVRRFTLTVTERDRPSNTATARSRVTALSLRLKPREARPSQSVRFLGRGFLDGTEVYGHYLRGDKLRKTVLLGRPEGPCGRLDARHRQIPVRRPAAGRWTLQVDNQPEYGPEPPGVFVRLPITVARAPAF